MKSAFANISYTTVPRRRQRHYSYDESVNEPAGLIADESVEVEEETPAEENQPIEEAKPEDLGDTATFED